MAEKKWTQSKILVFALLTSAAAGINVALDLVTDARVISILGFLSMCVVGALRVWFTDTKLTR